MSESKSQTSLDFAERNGGRLKVKYEPEEPLIEKVQSGEYGLKEYIQHHSRELSEEYERFCDQQNISAGDETSAMMFMEHRDKQLEEAIENGDA